MTLERQMLLHTHILDEEGQEIYLKKIAKQSVVLNWCIEDVRRAAHEDFQLLIDKNSKERSTCYNIVCHARLAGHPCVAPQLDRLIALRDELCTGWPHLVLGALHRPYEVLLVLMRLQKKPEQQAHVASVAAFLRYLPNRPVKQREPKAKPERAATPVQPDLPRVEPKSAQLGQSPRATKQVSLNNKTYNALKKKADRNQQSVESLVSEILRTSLQGQI